MKLLHAWIPGWWNFPFKAFLKGKEAADPPPLELHRSESKEEEKGCSAGLHGVLINTQAIATGATPKWKDSSLSDESL